MTPVQNAGSAMTMLPTRNVAARGAVPQGGGNFSKQLVQANNSPSVRPSARVSAGSTPPTQTPTTPTTPTPTPTTPGTASQPMRGDVDGNGTVDANDATALFDYLFRGGERPTTKVGMDANGDGRMDISDIVHILQMTSRPQAPSQPISQLNTTA